MEARMMRTRSLFAITILVLVLSSMTAYAQWDYRAPGIPRLPDGKRNLKAPAPRMPDGKPDLSGVWDDRCYSAECAQSGPGQPAVGVRRVWFFVLASGMDQGSHGVRAGGADRLLFVLGFGCRAVQRRIRRLCHGHAVVFIWRHIVRNDGDENRLGPEGGAAGDAACRKHIFANTSWSHHRGGTADVHCSFGSRLRGDHGVGGAGFHRCFRRVTG